MGIYTSLYGLTWVYNQMMTFQDKFKPVYNHERIYNRYYDTVSTISC